jgi:amidase
VIDQGIEQAERGPILDLADFFRGESMSSEALTGACLDAIERSSVNAVVVTRGAGALRDAAIRDMVLARLGPVGAARYPLLGVPVTIKACIDVRGLPTLLSDDSTVIASRDAPAVAAIRRAGAVIVGKTNAPPGGHHVDTDSGTYGRTRHPRDAARSPGGSSGGSAAAVASGHSVLDLGSDVAGSLRIPASLCGVVAMRPSSGALSAVGHHPASTGPLGARGPLTLGPVGRNVGDVRRAAVALGFVTETQAREDRLHRPLAAVSCSNNSDWSGSLDADVATGLATTVETLRRQGLEVETFSPEALGLETQWCLFQVLLAASDADKLDPVVARAIESRPVDIVSDPTALAFRGMTMSHRDWLLRIGEAEQVRLDWADFFRNHMGLLMPACPVRSLPPYPRHQPVLAQDVMIGGSRHPLFDLSFWSAASSLSGLPSVTLPVAETRSRFPIGAQIVGAPGDDRRILDTAQAIEATLRAASLAQQSDQATNSGASSSRSSS